LTLPDERYRSLLYARNFLRRLLDPSVYPRVPKEVRIEARYRLKHYPSTYELEQLAKACPDILKYVEEEDDDL
jgi:hypothetical protein